MRAPRVRFTVRGLMVAVAAVATALGIGAALLRAGQRAEEYRSRASQCAKREQTHRTYREFYEDMASALDRLALAPDPMAPGPDAEGDRAGSEPASGRADEARRKAARNREAGEIEARRAAYWGALRRKYDRAARYPWLSIEPDPPAP